MFPNRAPRFACKYEDIEIQKTKKRLLKLSAYVEETLRLSIKAYNNADVGLAQKVMDGDEIIDQQELDVEEECLKILALYQPVATDLRFIVAVRSQKDTTFDLL